MMGQHKFPEALEGLQTIHAPLNHYMFYPAHTCRARPTLVVRANDWGDYNHHRVRYLSPAIIHICTYMTVVLWISTFALLEHELSLFKNLTHNLGVGKSTGQQVPVFWHICPAKAWTSTTIIEHLVALKSHRTVHAWVVNMVQSGDLKWVFFLWT